MRLSNHVHLLLLLVRVHHTYSIRLISYWGTHIILRVHVDRRAHSFEIICRTHVILDLLLSHGKVHLLLLNYLVKVIRLLIVQNSPCIVGAPVDLSLEQQQPLLLILDTPNAYVIIDAGTHSELFLLLLIHYNHLVLPFVRLSLELGLVRTEGPSRFLMHNA